MKATLYFLASVVCLVLAAGVRGYSSPAEDVKIDPAMLRLFQPLPVVSESQKNPITEEKVALGRMLYFENRLSKNHDVSCNSCHPLDRYGVDGKPVSTGHKGQKGSRNSPTVYNAAEHLAQFWDGRAPDVEEQAKGPVMNPVEMAMPSAANAVAVLKSIPAYVEGFQRAFPGEKDPVTFDNMALAVGAFERRLLTPGRWDDFLKGDNTALTNEEKAGFLKFVGVGCARCHTGALLGGRLYQKLGVVEPWTDTSDLGRYQLTKRDNDKIVFKVPSLRNIGETGPYFHNGSVPSLDQAVGLMGKHQLGKRLASADIQSIVVWLNALKGRLPADYIREPARPKSTANTPPPDPS